MRKSISQTESAQYQPLILRTDNPEGKKEFDELIKAHQAIVSDTIKKQFAELIKIQNPSKQFSDVEIDQLFKAQIREPEAYGVWAYYSWLNKLVHLLAEEDFIKVRTNRNIYKIAPEDINTLRSKKIGVIGLSVGQAITNTIAMERICGEIRLADFDDVELSNMNRLLCSVSDIGLPKVVLAARRIAEIDPFIKIKCFTKGLDEGNIDEFLEGGGKLDILVEECDGIDMKILSRIKAREKGIPVIMETNDKGMLDVERFDLEQNRPLFHGRTPDIENTPVPDLLQKLKTLSVQEKIGYLAQIIGMDNVSDEMLASLPEMNKTIKGWPQLASAVALGAAMITHTCRRILLGKFQKSGRYFIEFNEIIN